MTQRNLVRGNVDFFEATDGENSITQILFLGDAVLIF